MQRHRASQPGSPGAVPSASRRLLSKATDQCLQAHLPAFPAGTDISKRPFTLPQRLPVSEPPWRGQSSRPAPSTPCRAWVRPVRILIPPRTPVGPVARGIITKIPLPDYVRHSPPFLGSPLPVGAFSDP